MKRTKKLCFVLAWLLSLAMLAGMLPASAVSVQAAETAEAAAVTVYLAVEQDGSYTEITPKTYTVTDGLAEQYGYTAKADQPTILDLLVAAHIEKYGDAFTKETAKDYLDMSGSYLTKAFQKNASSLLFFVNGVTPNDGVFNPAYNAYTGYTADNAQLKDNDFVQFIFLKDTMYWGDYYTWFDTDAETIETKQDVVFDLKGYAGAYYGCSTQETIDKMTLPMTNVNVSVSKVDDATAFVEAGKTDENGKVSLSFEKPGVYYLTASGMVSNDYGDTPIMSPWTIVRVKSQASTEELPYWNSFGKGQTNMPIVSAKTPQNALTTNTKWMTKKLSGANWEGVSAPLVVDGFLYVQQEKYLTKISMETGEVVEQKTLRNRCGYLPAPLAYGDGKIFVPENGSVEAFDAKTLEEVWYYDDPTGGQGNTPIYYRDGYVYTGFYKTNSSYEKTPANYVCLSTRELTPDEFHMLGGPIKEPEWRFESAGGFYWAGAYAKERVVVFGSEAAQGEETAEVVSVNRNNGAKMDAITVKGNVRSSISCDEESGKLYFTTNAGYLYETSVDEDGKFGEVNEIALGGASTSTPVVYKNRAYVGVSGPDSFGSEGHKAVVIDLEQKVIAYEAKADGYPQGTMLLSTAYEETTGEVLLYYTANAANGVAYVMKDKAGQTEADVKELYVPAEEYRNYTTASLVCDETGTLYYQNDTGCMFALETKAAIYGDVNDSGEVDAEDALEVLKAVVKLNTLDARQTMLADVDDKEGVTAEDALCILKKVVKLLKTFPVEQ